MRRCWTLLCGSNLAISKSSCMANRGSRSDGWTQVQSKHLILDQPTNLCINKANEVQSNKASEVVTSLQKWKCALHTEGMLSVNTGAWNTNLAVYREHSLGTKYTLLFLQCCFIWYLGMGGTRPPCPIAKTALNSICHCWGTYQVATYSNDTHLLRYTPHQNCLQIMEMDEKVYLSS